VEDTIQKIENSLTTRQEEEELTTKFSHVDRITEKVL